MKIVYVKTRDPILFNRPDMNIYDEELDQIVPMIVRDAGILIMEDEDNIWLGEMNTELDNPTLEEYGIRFPYYRNVRVISKSQIVHLQEFIADE